MQESFATDSDKRGHSLNDNKYDASKETPVSTVLHLRCHPNGRNKFDKDEAFGKESRTNEWNSHPTAPTISGERRESRNPRPQAKELAIFARVRR